MIIKGKVSHQALGPGFWGIIGDDGKQWRPLSLPSNLQKEGLALEVEAEEAKEQMSIFMWGTAIEIKKVIKP